VDAIRVTVRRGNVVEAVHRVHVATTDGEIWGDPGLTFFLRSASKPIQAIPFVEGYDDLADEEIAIACASHRAEPAQLDAVRRVLARAAATVDDLENGVQEGRPDGKLGHNCSGKHAGMLALCRARGWPLEGYRLAEHPCQQAMLAEVTAVAAAEVIATAVDGCGVVSFALPLEAMAIAFSRLEESDGGARIAAAMRAYPELIRGPRGLDTNLMQAFSGWIAKGGAEGLLCAAAPDGLALALKVEDGSTRALRPALGSFLESLDLDGSGFASVPVRNSRNEVVGELATC
jgi:L-asparaginase II